MAFKKAVTVSDSITANMIVEALKNNHIPSYKRDLGAGNYMRITSGYSVYGSEIYVDQEGLDKAKDIIKEIYGNIDEDQDEEETEGLEKCNSKFKRRRSIFLCAWLIFIIACSLCLIIVSR